MVSSTLAPAFITSLSQVKLQTHKQELEDLDGVLKEQQDLKDEAQRLKDLLIEVGALACNS